MLPDEYACQKKMNISINDIHVSMAQEQLTREIIQQGKLKVTVLIHHTTN